MTNFEYLTNKGLVHEFYESFEIAIEGLDDESEARTYLLAKEIVKRDSELDGDITWNYDYAIADALDVISMH